MIKSVFTNAYLLILVYLYLPIRGRSKVGKVEKVIVMPASKLGDLVCSTPIFRALRNTSSITSITICANESYRKLFDNHPDIDHYYSWNEGNVFGNVVNLRKMNIDVAIVTTPSFIASACFYLAGIRTILVPKVENGFSPYQTKSYRMIMPILTVVPHYMGNYAPREYLRLLEPIGISSNDTIKHLTFSDFSMSAVVEMVPEIVSSKIKIGIVPGVGNSIKQWNPHNFARISDYILSKYNATVFILGTKSDSQYSNKMKSDIKIKDNVVDTVGRFDLSLIKAFVSKLDLLIAVDTGLIYVAEAFNVPTIDIIGSMHENEQPPTGEIHKLVFLPNRKAEIHIMNSRCYNKLEAKKHIDNIIPEMVFPYIDDLLK